MSPVRARIHIRNPTLGPLATAAPDGFDAAPKAWRGGPAPQGVAVGWLATASETSAKGRRPDSSRSETLTGIIQRSHLGTMR